MHGFVGRVDELRKLEELVSAGDACHGVRLMVIAGTAGVGKSALALRFAHRTVEQFPDGQLFVNLRGYDSGPAVAPQVALERFLRALGVPPGEMPQGLEERAELYRSLLAGRHVLVLADNAATVGQVRPLLPGDAGCVVLVTSRGRLSGLSARDGARRLTLGLLPVPDAVALVEHAVSGNREADSAADVSELVRLCARLPLALRIAAERAAARPLMPLRELLGDLRGESSLWAALSTEDASKSDTVSAVFAWSYRALPPPAARVFRMIGIHPSAEFGIGAAAALSGVEPDRVRGFLDLLAGAHLLEQTGPGRYQFHDLLRAYAAGQVRQDEEPEEWAAALQRCAWWYLATAQAAVRTALPSLAAPPLPPQFLSAGSFEFTDSDEATRWYRAEQQNLMAVAQAVSAAGMWDLAWRFAEVLHGMHAVHLPLDDWFEMARLGAKAAEALDHERARAAVSATLADACAAAGRADEAIAHHTAALEVWERIGDRAGTVRSATSLGLISLARHDLARADAAFGQALDAGRAVGDELGATAALSGLAHAAFEGGRLSLAMNLADQVETAYRRAGADRRLLATPPLLRARVLRESGRLSQSAIELAAARQIADDVDLPLLHQAVLLEQGALEYAGQLYDQALETFGHALALGRALREPSREAQARTGLGQAMLAKNRAAEAVEAFQLAAAAYRHLNHSWLCARTLSYLADALDRVGQTQDARAARHDGVQLLGGFSDLRSENLRADLTNQL
ncbi:ATP-binding protein [Catenulispora rubra]|uniref:ATP-binding protein n=1 Tax=Catenulispora rubra TaxID=280293 RepID=UPI00189231EC|nr:tetratricopeptide repeat protein [Catenulispora rubra]